MLCDTMQAPPDCWRLSFARATSVWCHLVDSPASLAEPAAVGWVYCPCVPRQPPVHTSIAPCTFVPGFVTAACNPKAVWFAAPWSTLLQLRLGCCHTSCGVALFAASSRPLWLTTRLSSVVLLCYHLFEECAAVTQLPVSVQASRVLVARAGWPAHLVCNSATPHKVKLKNTLHPGFSMPPGRRCSLWGPGPAGLLTNACAI